jgi:cytochrome P450
MLALIEGVVLLARLLARYEFTVIAEKTPAPVAHLTVRARRNLAADFQANRGLSIGFGNSYAKKNKM